MLDLQTVSKFAVDAYYIEPNYTDPKTGSEFYIDVIDGIIYITFLGTNHWRDWLTNFQFILKKSRHKVKIHTGFFYGFKNLRKVLFKHIDTYKVINPSLNEVVILGHSSGGAIGCYAAYILARKKYEVTLFSFGSPAPGNKKFADRCNQLFKHYRFINIFDPIPKILPKWLGYHFSGELFKFNWVWRPHYIRNYWQFILKNGIKLQYIIRDKERIIKE